MGIYRGDGTPTAGDDLYDQADLDAAVAAAEAAQTAAELAETNAETAETNAETAETNAETAQTAAEAAQTAAETAQTAAELAETNAETAETNAETAETNAAASEAAAAASYDSFDDRYLGVKSSDPALDNDGNALVVGALYYKDTAVVGMKVYNGSSWDAVPGLIDLVDDTTPQLGGDLDVNGNDITGTVTVNGELVTTNDVAFRPNLLVNGMMLVWQDVGARSTAAAGSSQAIADNWSSTKITTAAYTLSRQVMSTDLSPGKYYCQSDVTTADASVASTDVVTFETFIEGNDFAQLRWGHSAAKDITITFLHAHTKTGTHSVTVSNGADNRSYTFEYTQSSANSWEVHTETIPGDTSGTWVDDENVAVRIRFSAMCGTTWQAPSTDAWVASNAFGSANQVNNMDSTSNFFRIGSVKIEEGSVATGLSPVDFATELHKCQRYLWKSYPYDTDYGDTGISGAGRRYRINATASQATDSVHVPFGQHMRVNPTLTAYATSSGTSGKIRDTVAGADVNANFPGTGNPYSADPSGQASGSNVSLNFQCHVRAIARMT